MPTLRRHWKSLRYFYYSFHSLYLIDYNFRISIYGFQFWVPLFLISINVYFFHENYIFSIFFMLSYIRGGLFSSPHFRWGGVALAHCYMMNRCQGKPDSWKPHNTKSEHRKSGSYKKTLNKFSQVRIYHSHKYLPCSQSLMKI